MPRVMNKAIWPYQVKIDRGDIKEFGERVQWLKDNLYHGGHYEPNWGFQWPSFYFTDEKEFTLFLLRWS